MEIKFFMLFIILCGVLNMILDKPFDNPLERSYCALLQVLILFWGCTKTCWFENHIIFHIITIPLSPYTNDSISSGFDEGPPSYRRNVLWLVSCPSALWLANSLDDVSIDIYTSMGVSVGYCPAPCQNSKFFQYRHIKSDFDNIEQEGRAEPLHGRILQDILKW